MNLKDYLAKEELNAREFAIICGCNYSTVYRILRGAMVSGVTAIRIENATEGKVTIEDLMYGGEKGKKLLGEKHE